MKIIIAGILMLIAVAQTRADSPITSTNFYEAYLDIEIVKYAAQSGTLDRKIYSFLRDTNVRIDLKAAVCNALGWKFEGKNNSKIYSEFLKDENAETGKHDYLVLGYLTALDDYFHPQNALTLLEKAKKMMPESTTVALIFAIVKAQHAMDSDWCQVWRLTEQQLADKKLNYDIKIKAMFIIIDYMILYEQDCK